MADPIVFVSHGRVKKDQLESLKKLSLEVWPVLEAEKPGTVFQHGYLSEDREEVHFIHVFPDAEAFDAHIMGAGERSGAAAEFIDTYGFEIYGTASDETLATLRQAPNVDLAIHSENLGGYIRLVS